MQLFIVRHGESGNNALVDSSKRTKDPKLTEKGEEQIVHVGRFMAAGGHLSAAERAAGDPVLDKLYCSPMWRCLRTAQPIGEETGLVPEVWIDIHESGGIYLDHGDERGVVGYPGMTRSEIIAEFSGYLLPEGVTEEGWWCGGFERSHLCHARAMGVVEQLRSWAQEDHLAGRRRRLALVSHGGFMHSFLMALGMGLPGNGIAFHHDNTAIDRVEFDAKGNVKVLYVNRVTHLPGELVSS